ncbi:hypothetical protein Xbed_00035 [Xenorhabdus beddingii]|uniref:Uncharacterized protein n=1 Tax=Xenorhabdus beddingii TaxID=40578 RepID=A0A1Y2SRK7_9GAMM|nr:hypothetical protein Xbed_00035 [Xenorhabdus beddingii]
MTITPQEYDFQMEIINHNIHSEDSGFKPLTIYLNAKMKLYASSLKLPQ